MAVKRERRGARPAAPGEGATGGRHRSAAATLRATPTPPARRALLAGWLVATALITWSFGFTRMLNSDLWFHLAAGREIAHERRIPTVDSWSFTAAGQPWHNHEWLSGLVFHAWDEAFGLDHLVIWQWGVLAFTFLLLFDLLRHWRAPWIAWLLVLGTLAVAAPFFDIRPHLWSLLGFALVARLTLLPSRVTLLLPVVFALWANLHGGVVFGLAALLAALAAHWLAPGSAANAVRLRRQAPWLAAACLLATLINPFGVRVLSYPLGLALAGDSPSRRILVEWLPPFRPGGIRSPLYPWALAVATVAVVLLLRRVWRADRRPELVAALLLLGGTGAMSLTSRRFIPLFAMALAVALAQVAAERGDHRRGRRWEVLALGAALAVAVVRLQPYPLGPRAFSPLVRLDRMPEETLRFALANGLRGDVFAYFQWGGYVHYRSGGSLRVFLDPRSETVFSPQIQRAYQRVANMAPGWQSVIERSGAEFVLWPFSASRPVLDQLVATGRWRPLHGGPEGVLLARADLPLPPLRPVPSGWHSWGLAREAVAEGRLADAEARLTEALAQEPTLLPPCLELVDVQRRLGRVAAATETARRCERIFPGVASGALASGG